MTIRDLVNKSVIVDAKIRINESYDSGDVVEVYESDDTLAIMSREEIESIGNDLLSKDVVMVSVGSDCVLNIWYDSED